MAMGITIYDELVESVTCGTLARQKERITKKLFRTDDKKEKVQNNTQFFYITSYFCFSLAERSLAFQKKHLMYTKKYNCNKICRRISVERLPLVGYKKILFRSF